MLRGRCQQHKRCLRLHLHDLFRILHPYKKLSDGKNGPCRMRNQESSYAAHRQSEHCLWFDGRCHVPLFLECKRHRPPTYSSLTYTSLCACHRKLTVSSDKQHADPRISAVCEDNQCQPGQYRDMPVLLQRTFENLTEKTLCTAAPYITRHQSVNHARMHRLKDGINLRIGTMV